MAALVEMVDAVRLAPSDVVIVRGLGSGEPVEPRNPEA
jgi:hypothetical protein